MKPVYISIDQEKTGRRIKALMKENNLSVRDMQEACGFERPQAVYKWLSGKNLPSIESLVILAALFHVSIDGILVKCGDAAFFNIIIISYISFLKKHVKCVEINEQ